MNSQEDYDYGTDGFFNRGIRKWDRKICRLFIPVFQKKLDKIVEQEILECTT